MKFHAGKCGNQVKNSTLAAATSSRNMERIFVPVWYQESSRPPSAAKRSFRSLGRLAGTPPAESLPAGRQPTGDSSTALRMTGLKVKDWEK